MACKLGGISVDVHRISVGVGCSSGREIGIQSLYPVLRCVYKLAILEIRVRVMQLKKQDDGGRADLTNERMKLQQICHPREAWTGKPASDHR